MTDTITILTIEQVCEALTLSEPTLRRYAKSDENFPRMIRIGARRVGFLKSEIETYLARQRVPLGQAA